ncbi:MAG: hypothetical protein ACQKBT_05520, partial [Puniceicoccales bacterium]
MHFLPITDRSRTPVTHNRSVTKRIVFWAATCFLTLTSSAANWTWDAGDGSWDTATNWDPNGVPDDSTAEVFLSNGGGVTTTISLSKKVNSLWVGSNNILRFDFRGASINFFDSGAFSNSGIIEFTDPAGGESNESGIFLNNAGTQTNAGTIRVSAGTSVLRSSDLTNDGGLLLATSGGTLSFRNSSTITGGTLRSESGGLLDMGGYQVPLSAVNLDGVSIDNQSEFQVRQNASDRFFGNYDTITNLNSGSVFTNKSGATTYVLNEATGGTVNGDSSKSVETQNAYLNVNTGATFINSGTLLIQANGSVGDPFPFQLSSLGATFTVASDATGFTNTGTVKVVNLSPLSQSNANFESAQ